MKFALSARARRALALALAAALLAAAYFAILRPLVQAYRAYDERIAGLRASLEKHRRAALERPRTERLLAEHRGREGARPYYLAQSTPALAAAELQRMVKRAVEQGKGELTSLQVLPGQRAEPLREVALRVRARCDARGLQAMLHALESSLPILFVDHLSVEAQRDGELAVGFDVSAFAHERQPAPSPTAAPGSRTLPGFPPAEDFDALVERVLFDRSRRPARLAASVPGKQVAAEERGLVLAGVLVMPKRRLALVQQNGSERLIGLQPGQVLDGWQLLEVRADRILLRRGSQSLELPLRK
jgi:general secretion pathway protein M